MGRILPGLALGVGLALGSVNPASALPIRCFGLALSIDRSPTSDYLSSVLSRRAPRAFGDCDEGISFDLDSVLESVTVTNSLSRSSPRVDLDDLGDLSHGGGKAKSAGKEKAKPGKTNGRLLKEPRSSSRPAHEDRKSGPPPVKKKHALEASRRSDKRHPD